MRGRAPEDPMLGRTDGSEMCISEMAVAHVSMDVAPANFKVTGQLYPNSLGGTGVHIGFERGLVVSHVTGLVPG